MPDKGNLKAMVADWLTRNGYDGLFNAEAECGCQLSDLMPCGEPGLDCASGYRVPCPGPGSETCEGDCEFHIVPVKKGD